MLHKFLKIHPKDNVLVALTDLPMGESINFQNNEITLINNVKAKHKFAEEALNPGQEIFMYGIIVGKANRFISKGEVLTTQNISHKTAAYTGKRQPFKWEAPDVQKWTNKTFMGYHRADGKVGTANYWLVVPLVFCENRNVEIIKQAFVEELGFEKPNRFKAFVQQMSSLYSRGETDKIGSLTLDTVEKESTEKIFKNIDGIKFL